MNQEPVTLFILVPDLVARSKIKGALEGESYIINSVRSLDQLQTQLSEVKGQAILLVDLNIQTLNPFEAISACLPTLGPSNVVAFFSHVDSELEEQANGLGVDKVYPRSKFFSNVAEILKG